MKAMPLSLIFPPKITPFLRFLPENPFQSFLSDTPTLINNNFRMSKVRIITMYKLYPVQAQAAQENGKRPRAGCNIQLIKMVQDIF